MSGDSATETTPPRRSWTVWIWRSGIMLLFALPLIYAFSLMLARTGIRLVESSGGYVCYLGNTNAFDPFLLRSSRDFEFLHIDSDVFDAQLANSSLRADQLKFLNRFSNLRLLTITSDQLGPEVKQIVSKGLLWWLVIKGNSLKTDGLDDFTKLKRLGLHNWDGRMDLSGLPRMPRLQELSIYHDAPLTGSELAPLADCQQLERVYLHGEVEIKAWSALAKCPQLTGFKWSSYDILRSWKGLSALKDAPQLQELTLEQVTRDTLQELQQVTQLASLHIGSGRLEADDLKLLQPLQKLQKITFIKKVLFSPQESLKGSTGRFESIEIHRKQVRELLKDLLPKAQITIEDY